IGLSHFRRISKPGRDLSEAAMAEAEFKEFLLRYPDSDLIRKVKSKLRQVQELIADANFRIAKFYSQKRANKAVISRLEEIADDYPSYSRADSALWLLANTLEKVNKSAESVPYYSRIITDYPLSAMVEESKERLQALGQVVPRPTRASVIRAEADALHKSRRSLLGRFGGMMSSRPNLSATRRGPVRVTKVDVPTGPLVARAKPSRNGEENEKGEGVGEGVGELKLELKSVTAEGSSDGSVVEGETTAPSGNTVGVSVISDSASPGKKEKEDEGEEKKEEGDTSGGGNGDR
ncbi:MAG: outer membrane protein assembly factor BamD, partial [Acidobacteriota bacterium]